MANYLVFREEPLTASQIGHREEHNERLADHYNNNNIQPDMSADNFYFKKPSCGYAEYLQRKVDGGEINLKGLKKDGSAHLYSEIIVAVNRDYWIDKSFDEVKEFFEAAYSFLSDRFGEENIISAVLHCDEISEGKINYHMHCVSLPTVTKERYYSKRSTQYKELADKIGEENIKKDDRRLLKSVECQLSHAKFFASTKDDDHRIVYSYSKWQDDILTALDKAGFKDLRRGIANQKAVHLHPMAYKAIMERIEDNAQAIAPDVEVVQQPDGSYNLSAESFDAFTELHKQVCKEKAAYDLAVDSLTTEQNIVWNRQNEIYRVALRQKDIQVSADTLEELQKEAGRLIRENEQLKSALEFMKGILYKIGRCFAKFFKTWEKVRTEPDVDFADVCVQFDNIALEGAAILRGEDLPDAGRDPFNR